MAFTPTDEEFLKEEQCMRLSISNDYKQIAFLLLERRRQEKREGKIDAIGRLARIKKLKAFYASLSRRADPYSEQQERSALQTMQETRQTRSRTKSKILSSSMNVAATDEIENTQQEGSALQTTQETRQTRSRTKSKILSSSMNVAATDEVENTQQQRSALQTTQETRQTRSRTKSKILSSSTNVVATDEVENARQEGSALQTTQETRQTRSRTKSRILSSSNNVAATDEVENTQQQRSALQPTQETCQTRSRTKSKILSSSNNVAATDEVENTQQERSALQTTQETRQTRSRTKSKVLSSSNNVAATDEVENTPTEVVTDSHEEQENRVPVGRHIMLADRQPERKFKVLEKLETVGIGNSKDIVKKLVKEMTAMIESSTEENIFINLLRIINSKLLEFESDKISSFNNIHKSFNEVLSTVDNEHEDSVVSIKKAHSEFIYMFKTLGLCCGLLKEEVLETIGCDEDEKCRIRRSDKYYHYKSEAHDFAICVEHFNLLSDEFMTRDGKKALTKTDFMFKTHDEVENEAMEACDYCGKHWHESCRMGRLFDNSDRLKCCKIHDNAIKKMSAEHIPVTKASDLIENFVNNEIKKAFPDAKKIIIREVARKIAKTESNNKISRLLEKTTGDSLTLTYRFRQFIALQNTKGRELLFFSFTVQEYLDSFKKGWTNLEYVDSIKYISDPKLRTTIYQTILLGYFKFAASIGFQHAHIFAMAPQEGDSFFFRGRPEAQKVSNQQHLLKWYHSLLNVGKDGIISCYKTMNFSSDYKMLDTPEILKRLYFVGGLFTTHFKKILKTIKISNFKNKQYQRNIRDKIGSVADENANNLFYIELKPTRDPTNYDEQEIPKTITGEGDEWMNFQETEKLEFSSLDRAHYATMIILKKIIIDINLENSENLDDSFKLFQEPNEWIRH